LGKPQPWPHPTVFDKAISDATAVSIQLINDKGDALTDSSKQKFEYKHFAIFDVVYMARKGLYFLNNNDEEIYVEDEIQHRVETQPMNHLLLKWGKNSSSAVTLTEGAAAPSLTFNEAPVKFGIGETIVKTIEGWCCDLSNVAVEGTVNDSALHSFILDRDFPALTLKLRSITATPLFSFRSYRDENPSGPPPTPTPPLPKRYERSGRTTLTLRLQYEYREDGWERFWRNTPKAAEAGYYHMIDSEPPYANVIPFPAVDHKAYWE